jgi:MFS family permease
MTSAPVLRALVAVVGSAPAIMFVLNFGSQYLVERWRMPRGDVGGWLVIPPLLFDAGAVAFGWYASRREARAGVRRTQRGLLSLAMLLAASLALAPFASSPGVAMLLFGAAAAGGGGIYVLITADMLARVPAERTSAAGGMTAAAQSLAHIVASPLVGAAIDRTGGYSGVLVALGLVAVPTTLAFVYWPGLRSK